MTLWFTSLWYPTQPLFETRPTVQQSQDTQKVYQIGQPPHPTEQDLKEAKERDTKWRPHQDMVVEQTSVTMTSVCTTF